MLISEVEHQARAQRIVAGALSSQRTPHAYIFYGPEGVGRERFARGLAGILLSGGESSSIEDDHPDLHVIYRELIKQHSDPEVRKRKGLILGIDVIREFVIHPVANKPVRGRAKVFIIREAELMNPAAQNALLKTLEEPPETTFLVLIAASLDRLLPTVRSRCQIVPFGLLPPAFVAERLLATVPEIGEEEARFCAMHAGGSLGVALRHHEDGLFERDRRVAEALAGLGQVGPTAIAKRLIDEAKELGECHKERDPDVSDTEAQRRGLKSLLGLVAMSLREGLAHSVGAVAEAPGAHAMGGDLPPRRLTEAIRTVLTTERQLELNANVQLCVEGFLIRLSRICRVG